MQERVDRGALAEPQANNPATHAPEDSAIDWEPPNADEHRGRILTLTTALLVSFLVFPAFDFYLYFAYNDVGAVIMALTILGLWPVVAWARWLATHHQIKQSITVLVTLLMAASFAIVFLRTYLYPVLAVGSLLAVTVALPFVSTRVLKRLAVAGAANAAVIAVVGTTFDSPWASTGSPLAEAGVTAAALTVALVLIFFMVWVYSSRLGRALHSTESARQDVERVLRAVRTRDQERERYMRMTAHEMGTPLTPLRVQLHLLQTGALGPLDDRQATAIRTLERNFQRLERLAGDLLDTSRVEAKRLRLHTARIPVAQVVSRSVEAHQAVAHEWGIRLASHLDLHAEAFLDEARLGQVLDNLLSNALKYTPTGGQVEVHLTRDGPDVQIRFADNGIGLTPEALRTLFRPFGQTNAPLHAQPSTGLGLFVARGIVDAHGGRLAAASDGPGRGSTFTIELPGAAPATPQGLATRLRAPSQPRPEPTPAASASLLTGTDRITLPPGLGASLATAQPVPVPEEA